MKQLLTFFLCVITGLSALHAQSWTADNGNGTYTNPLFYDEFSDPDMIRVGNDFYLTGTTMHSVPGLPVLHSKDLVNWQLVGYALDRFNLGDEFDLTNGKEAYGQGIWAPCIRFHNGVFYIFSNINKHGLQVFTATNPAGPWKQHNLGRHIYDLSVLFENQRIYIAYGVGEIKMIELKTDLSGFVPNSERVIIPEGNAMGEGNHLYKINGKYYITNADNGRLQCARATNIYGPYETTVVSAKETMGTSLGWLAKDIWLDTPLPAATDSLTIYKQNDQLFKSVPMHQGGIVDLPNGDWWGFSMMDFRSVGRTTFLSPVTWKDGWPFYGVEGNLGRSPRTWLKPRVANQEKPHAPYQRNDNFKASKLASAWQWNHNPVNTKWQLKDGSLKLHTLPAKDFLWARNTLTQRGVGPESEATVELNGKNLKDGDIAGLGLMNIPFAWVGILRRGDRYVLRMFDQHRQQTIDKSLNSPHIYLRAFGNFDTDIAQLSYSTDGNRFKNIGDSIRLPYQLKTFQGTRYALFAYNTKVHEGGYASFSNFVLKEPLANRSNNIPLGKTIMLTNLADRRMVWANPHGMLCPGQITGSSKQTDSAYAFKVLDRGNGKVVLQAVNGTGFVTITGQGLSADVRLIKEESAASLLLWQDMLRGQCMLLSLKTNRYVGLDPHTGELYSADWFGTLPGRKDGTVFTWKQIN
ncbi:glycoside hydrolase 43 family protein [Mucilaginibacter sp. RS28]|uniref:Glycoside hydrolase 43 family protein n=1 Tax=Mucilaginibacter straminoryzae TaxID=2932774 RepID=A0A9X1X113_9SPHI|nr:glycoside hydrolase 43 family protein [Mucilaginibacter straminoryzae]MCJ8208415.1 glycoside hydrolase 43 family protein [Mucilaginibacter straminoryzae]